MNYIIHIHRYNTQIPHHIPTSPKLSRKGRIYPEIITKRRSISQNYDVTEFIKYPAFSNKSGCDSNDDPVIYIQCQFGSSFYSAFPYSCAKYAGVPAPDRWMNGKRKCILIDTVFWLNIICDDVMIEAGFMMHSCI